MVTASRVEARVIITDVFDFTAETESWSLWTREASTMVTPAISPGLGQSAVILVSHRGNSMKWYLECTRNAYK